MKIMEMPLTLDEVQAWNLPAFEDMVRGLGNYPGAVFDFTSMLFTNTETKITVAAYRNQSAWDQGVPLPGFPLIQLRLTRAEHVALEGANPGFAALEAAVRDAAWSLMTSHPKMLRGPLPAQGEEDTRQNAFATGTLIDV